MNQRPRNFLFFNLIPKTVFLVLVGMFTTFTLTFSALYCLFSSGIFAQLSCFFALGILIFSISYFWYKRKFFSILKIPSYKSYLISKKNLKYWIFYTVNVYFLLCWYMMLILGLFDGFKINNPSSSTQKLLINDDYMWIRAVILFFVHVFLLSVYFFGKKRISKMFIIAHHKLNIRRKNIETSKDDAAKVVYQ